MSENSRLELIDDALELWVDMPWTHQTGPIGTPTATLNKKLRGGAKYSHAQYDVKSLLLMNSDELAQWIVDHRPLI
jgi:hypothetical protein